MPGNSVSTSKRITGALALRRGRGGLGLRGFLGDLRGLLGFEFFPLLHVLREDRGAVFGRLRPDALPVLDAAWLELDARVLVGDVRVVHAEFLDHLAVARLPVVDGDDAV